LSVEKGKISRPEDVEGGRGVFNPRRVRSKGKESGKEGLITLSLKEKKKEGRAINAVK